MHSMFCWACGVLMSIAGSTEGGQEEGRPSYTIYRAGGAPILVDGRLDELAWTAAPDVGKFVFPWYEGGKKEQTVAKILWDETSLYVAFICEDAYIWAEHTLRRSRVYLDDTVEVFTAPDPDRPQAYFNLEMNVLGALLDGFHPEGRGTGNRDAWHATGIKIRTTITGMLNDDSDQDEYWVLEAAIPFSNFTKVAKNTPPAPGDIWHLNLNRLGGKTNRQHSQWSASQTPGPSFHVPEDFGRVMFSERASPFWR